MDEKSPVRKRHKNAFSGEDDPGDKNRQKVKEKEVSQGEEGNERRERAPTKRIKKVCAVTGCLNNNLSKSLFAFPRVKNQNGKGKTSEKDKLERCKKWILHAGNKSLLDIDPEDIHRKAWVCEDHFSEVDMRPGKRRRLNDSCVPVPTRCQCTPLGEEMVSRYGQNVENRTGETNASGTSLKQRDFNTNDSDSNAINYCQTSPAEETDFDKVLKSYAAIGCTNNEMTAILVAFPKVTRVDKGETILEKAALERCKTWILRSGNSSLVKIDPRKIHEEAWLCQDHFCRKEKGHDFVQVRAKSLPNIFQCTPLEESMVRRYGEDLHKADERPCTEPETDEVGVNASSATEDKASVSFEAEEEHEKRDSQDISQGEKRNERSERAPTKRIKKTNRNLTVCSATGCENTNSTHSMFSFPKINRKQKDVEILIKRQLERCREWVRLSGNKQLLNIHPSEIFKHAKLCSEHFIKPDFIIRKHVNLKNTAVPSRNIGETLSQQEMSNYGQELRANAGAADVTDLLNGKFGKKAADCIREYENKMKMLHWKICEVCKEKHLTRKDNSRCSHGKRCIEFSSVNNMDPGDVPEIMKSLSFIEEQLIALVHPIVVVYKLKGLQYGYRGNVISFPQNVNDFAKQLPRHIKEMYSVITVRFAGENLDVKDFDVDAEKLVDVLLWLKSHNPYYADIEISEENLASLPRQGNVYSEMKGYDIEPNSDVEVISSEETELSDENPLPRNDTSEVSEVTSDANSGRSDDDTMASMNDGEERVHYTCVTGLRMPHQDEQVTAKIVDWPSMSATPVNEFTTPGFIAMAFPTLFPTGQADYNECRLKKVALLAYIKHMLFYHDGRFAQHRTFRFYVFNLYMRSLALTDGVLTVKRHSELLNMTVGELKEVLKTNPDTIRKFIFQISNIRGTKAYWSARLKELIAMIEQLGLPTIFLTLSFPDLHLPDLYKLMPGCTDPNTLSMSDRKKLLQENPWIVDMFFDERVKTFTKELLEKNYQVVDQWYRIEFQHRGSPHLHGLFWLSGAPDIANVKQASDQEKEEIVKYFDDLVKATNPMRNCAIPMTHPSQLRLTEISDLEEDIAQIVNHVQRHTKCSEAYCLRVNKKTGKTECRFKFPAELRENSGLEVNEAGNMEFVPARDDPLVNKYNDVILQVWRGNMDISPILSIKRLLEYVAKYISKSETKTQDCTERFHSISGKLNDDDHVKKFLQRLYIKSCAERDFSAQEVCHILMGNKLHSSGGRQFVKVNFKCTDNVTLQNAAFDQDNAVLSSKTVSDVFMKYQDRPEHLSHLTLTDAAKKYDMLTWKKKKKQNIVCIYPKLKLGTDPEDNDLYFRQKVMLHVPWRSSSDLKLAEETWEEVYEKNNRMIQEGLQISVDDVEDDDYEEESPEEDVCNEEWMIASQLRYHANLPTVELGRRECDTKYDWSVASKSYEQYGSIPQLQQFIESEKKKNDDQQATVFDGKDIRFSEDQKKVITLFKQQVNYLEGDSNGDADTGTTIGKRTIVQGKAGTGKSLLIKYLTNSAASKFGSDSVWLLAPTGIAAVNINGRTVHSVMHIPQKQKNFKMLSGDKAREFSEKIRKVKFLIIDEYSMLGCNLIGMMDQRCRQGLNNYDEEFGGLFVYFFGDVKQLPPVLDKAVYSLSCQTDLAIIGKATVNSFSSAIVLETCHRQKDTVFLNILDNISKGTFDSSDYAVLSRRFCSRVPEEEKAQFASALRLFSTKLEVHLYNLSKMNSLIDPDTRLHLPIARIPAVHNCKKAAKCTSEDAQGLEPVIYLAKGTKIMLRSNLWVNRSLVNGSIGEVVDILYCDDESPPDGFPSLVMCTFENYCGPGLGQYQNIVPIPLLFRQWTSGTGQTMSRIQFPLVPSYACSIHKSQGLTLDKAVIDLGSSEFSLGLSYVALSRVKTLKGVLLEPCTYDRLRDFSKRPKFKERAFFEKKLLDMAKAVPQ